MKEAIFITYQMGLQGSYLNHLDLQQYLKDRAGYKIRFYCESVDKLFETVKMSRRSYTFDKKEAKEIEKETVELDGVVITDFKTLIKMHDLDMYIICKKLIVMDSIELCYHLKDMKQARFYYNVDLDKVMKNFYTEETLFLMPPNSHDIFKVKHPNFTSQVFFKNVNVDMIDTIECENRPGYFYRWDDSKNYKKRVLDKFGESGVNYEPEWMLKRGRKIPLKYNEVGHIFDYEMLVYRRRKYLEFQEQFGRLIFEYILLGKTVYFKDQPYTDDGLTDYLRHFDIKFDGNKIITTAKELREKMKEYDDETISIFT